MQREILRKSGCCVRPFYFLDEDDDVKRSFVAFMRILISVIITDDGGVTMQRIGFETFAQGFSEGLSLLFLSNFDCF